MKRLLILLVFLTGIVRSAQATHIQGGGITYQCLGGNQYAITLKVYFDCGTYGINTNFGNVTLNITNNCGFPAQNITLTKVAAQSNIQVSQLCNQQLPNSECSGGTQPGVWMATWSGVVTLPGQCNSWHFWYQTCCWNTNTNTPGQQSQLFHTTLNNTTAAGGCDSSPTMGPDPIPYMCVNQPNTYSLGASDPNGNNISYSLAAAQNGSPTAPTVLTYNAGYTGGAPIPGMTINPTTGLLTVTPPTTGNFIVQVNCSTFNAAGVLIGVVQQQLQIVVINCSNAIPTPPVGGVSGASGNITINNPTSVTFCAGQQGCFNVVFTDANAANVITLTSTVTTALPGSTFVVTGTNPVTGTVCWTPNAGSPVNSNVTFTGEDNACPITGQNFFNVDVSVINTCCNPPTMASTAVCSGASTGSVSATGNGAAPFDYVWVNTATGATVANVNNLPGIHTVNNLPAGTYQVTVTDNNGCVQTGTATITSNPIPVAPITVTWNCPAQNSVTLTAVPNPTGGTFLWSPGGATTAAITVTPAVSTTYTVTYTRLGCTATTSVTINPLLISNVTPTATACFGGCTGTAFANPTGGTPPYTYSWTGGQTTQTAGSLCAGSYTVTVTDQNSCTATATATITQPTQITGTINITPPTCNGQCNGTVSVNAAGGTGALQYAINGGAYQASNSFTGLCAGPVVVNVRDANNCTITINGTITQPPALTGSVTGTTPAICGNNTGTISVTGNGGTPGYTYSTTGAGGTFGPSPITGLAPGPYTITIKDNNGCLTTATATVTASNSPVAGVQSQVNVSCFGGVNGSVLLSATGGTAPIQYQIDPPGAVPPTAFQASNSFTGLGAGTYGVTVQDGNGCVGTTTFTITAPPQLSYTSTPTAALCNGQCNGQITINATGGTPPYQYSSNNGLTFNAANPMTGLCAGNINVVTRDANGCLANSVVVVTQPAALSATFVNTNPVCFGSCDGQIVANASGGTVPYQYSTTGVPGLQSSNTLTGLCAGAQNVLIQDSNGCQFTSTQTLVNPPQIVINTVSTTPSNCGFNDGGFEVAASGPNAIVSYNIGFGAQPTGVFPSLVGGGYTVTVLDALGCSNTAFVAVNDIQMSAVLNSTTDATCFGSCDGQVDVVNVAGALPISYELDNSSITSPSGIYMSLCAGNHIITVYDAGLCVASVLFTINEPDPITFSTTVVNVACNGGSTGQITFTNAAGGTPGYEYSIDGGATFQASPVFPGLPQNTYSLVVRDANFCTEVGTATITENPPLTYVLNTTDLTCFNNSTGFLQVVSSGGTPSYQTCITGPVNFPCSANFTFPNIPAGTYNITVQDALGCQVTGVAVIAQPTPVAAAYVTSPATCNNICDGSIQANASGGTPPYVYSSDGGTTFGVNSLLSLLCDGTYQVQVKDSNGCLIGSTQTITEPTPVTLNATSTPATCNNSNGTITLTAAGGNPGGYEYSIDGITFVPGNIFNGLAPGFFNVEVQDLANGCPATDTITVLNQAAPILVGVFVTDPTCNNLCDAIADVTAVGGTGVLQYNIGGANQASNLFNGQCSGNYTATVTDANGCTDAQPFTINNPTLVTINTSSTNLLCFEDFSGTVTINASGGAGGYQYSIDNGGVFQSGGQFTVLPIGTYNIIVQDANGCQATGQEILTEPALLQFTAVTVTQPTCFLSCDAQVQTTVTGGTIAAIYTYNWSNSLAGTSSPNAINICNGSYALTVVDDNGCQIDTAFTITDPPQVVMLGVTSTDALCNGNCDGTLTVSANNATQYSVNGGPFQASNTFTGLCANTYQVVAADNNNCPATTVHAINEPAPLQTYITPSDTSCFGGVYFLVAAASGGTPNYQFVWGHTGSPLPVQDVYPTAQTTYTVSAIDANGCTSPVVTSVIDVHPLFTATVSNDTLVCPGAPVILSSTGSLGVGPYLFIWSTGDTIISQTSSVTVVPPSPQAYTVNVKDLCGDSLILTINAGWHPLPTPMVTASASGCGPLDVLFTNTTPAGMVGGTCSWLISNGASGNSCDTISTTLLTAGLYDATLTVTSPEGCVNDSTFVGIVEVYPDPVADFTWNPVQPTILDGNVTFNDISIGAVTWNWDIAGLMTSNSPSPSYNFTQLDSGNYEICLNVTSVNGCADTVCHLMTLFDVNLVYVPNTFTPDGDGVNDIFIPVVRGIDTDDYELMIFDRWGEVIFLSQLSDKGWDGTHRSKECKQDVYVWKLKVSDRYTKEKKEYKGHVNLLR